LVVVAAKASFRVEHARAVAALSASGKSVVVVTAVDLADDVLPWLPKDCVYSLGDSQRDWWSVSDGILALTPATQVDPDLVENMVDFHVGAAASEDASRIVHSLRQISIGVAWDRPICVPLTPYSSDGILNRHRIRGVTAGTWQGVSQGDLGFGPDENKLWFGEQSALLTLNLSLGSWPCLLLCGPFFRYEDGEDDSTCVIPEIGHGEVGRLSNPLHASGLQSRPGQPQGRLEPMPSWIRTLPQGGQDLVVRLLDRWASGFFRGFVAGGSEWLCRHGTDLDLALQTDWTSLLDRLEVAGRTHDGFRGA
jgi:hypothetical protein